MRALWTRARCRFMVMIVILAVAGAASSQVTNATNDPGNNNKADASGLFIYVHQPAESLAMVTPVEILVTDSKGRRTGFDVGTGTTLREIPNSHYSAEAIADDSDPASGLTTEEVKSFEAMWPASGKYSLQIIGTGTGPYTIDILAYDFNATESIRTITGNATRGAGTVYQVGYSSIAGSRVSATLLNTIYTIVATAGSGGSISPSGTVLVYSGGNRTFAIRPNTGYKVADVTVDGVSQGAITSYNFTNITASHTVTATFTK